MLYYLGIGTVWRGLSNKKNEYLKSVKEGKNEKFLCLYCCLCMMATMFTGCGGGGGEGTESEPLKVGPIYPLSGANALLGNQCLTLSELRLNMVNEAARSRQPVGIDRSGCSDSTTATTESR